MDRLGEISVGGEVSVVEVVQNVTRVLEKSCRNEIPMAVIDVSQD